MRLKNFDKKFGLEFVGQLPDQPGVYFVYDESDKLIYVGKAKNLRRRLSQYRNAKRRKAHKKMRAIVKHAARIETQVCTSDLDACLLEAQLIQKHRPRWNVAGAFYFMYPMIATSYHDGTAYFAYTTHPEYFEGFRLHGAYRSREITIDAFFALSRLLTYVGHPAKTKTRPHPHTYVFAFRQIPENWMDLWSRFLKGESREALQELVLALVENAGARRRKRTIQEELDLIARFWRHEIQPLAKVRKKTGHAEFPVSQLERDILFLKYRHLRIQKAQKPAKSIKQQLDNAPASDR